MEWNNDCLQRHQIRMVRLPNDGVDPSGLHGPCRVFRLGRPLDIAELRDMPEELQRMYLQRLRRWGGTEESVIVMLGSSREELIALLKRHRVVLDKPNPTAWADFIGAERG